jgi:hypothetical protein
VKTPSPFGSCASSGNLLKYVRVTPVICSPSRTKTADESEPGSAFSPVGTKDSVSPSHGSISNV